MFAHANNYSPIIIQGFHAAEFGICQGNVLLQHWISKSAAAAIAASMMIHVDGIEEASALSAKVARSFVSFLGGRERET